VKLLAVGSDLGELRRLLRHLVATIDGASAPSTEALLSQQGLSDLFKTRVVRPDGAEVAVFGLTGLIDPSTLERDVLRPLQTLPAAPAEALPQAFQVRTIDEARQLLIGGAAIVIAGNVTWAYRVGSYPKRQIDMPDTERAIFGPKDAFIEDLDTNVGLLRRQLPDPDLMVDRLSLGTKVARQGVLMHVAGIADPSAVEAVAGRLKARQTPRVGFISSLVPMLLGPQMNPFVRAEFTERPARVATQLLRGKIALLLDGSPFAMVVPHTMADTFTDDETSFPSPLVRLFVRFIRVVALAGATFLPGLYVAILSVNPVVLPGLLALQVAFDRQTIPYPVVTETFILLIVLDVLAESTISMKSVLGPAISIVGSIIIGDAAVRSDLASNLSVILVAVTALGTFITPWFTSSYAYRLWKYPILFFSAVMGIAGWGLGILFMMTALAGERSLGLSYLTPVTPLQPGRAAGLAASGPDREAHRTIVAGLGVEGPP